MPNMGDGECLWRILGEIQSMTGYGADTHIWNAEL